MEYQTDMWKSHRGDFCINSPDFCDAVFFEAVLRETASLMPQKMNRVAFLESDFLADEIKNILKILFSFEFSRVYLFAKPGGKKCIVREPCISCASLQEALLRQQNHGASEVLFFCSRRKMEYQKVCSFIEGAAPQSHLLVDLSAIVKNIEAIRFHVPQGTRLLAMVKANGYGTDSAFLSRFLAQSGVDIIGVAHLDEALSLRYEGIDQDIFVINASENEMEKAILARAEVGVSTKRQIIAAHNAAKKQKTILSLHLHVDTGMKRFGCHIEEALKLASFSTSLSHVKLSGIFSHFPSAEDATHDLFSQKQISQFLSVVARLKQRGIHPPHVHIANSAALFRFPIQECSMVRVGISLFGYSSSSLFSLPHLHPALSLETTIAGLIRAKKGETVGYGRRFQIPHEKATIAILPIGYHDGIHRLHSGQQSASIRSQKAPFIGSICMDFLMVDVTDLSKIKTGDKVVLFGKEENGGYLCPLAFSEKNGSILHEFLACLGPRIRRLFSLTHSIF